LAEFCTKLLFKSEFKVCSRYVAQYCQCVASVVILICCLVLFCFIFIYASKVRKCRKWDFEFLFYL